MEITQYFEQQEDTVSFTEQQASAFAKGIAGDFNPIHDPGTKRFCVPGDLLFCVLLHRYGVARHTAVQFSGMLDGNTRMCLPQEVMGHAYIKDTRDRDLLSLFLEGERSTEPQFVTALSQAYVRFSGQTFPDVLVPLMRGAEVMINPNRPLIIYKDMDIELTNAAKQSRGNKVSLGLSDTNISVNGRKGAVRLRFDIRDGNELIGRGEKNIVLGGLREYDDQTMQSTVVQYNKGRDSYTS